MTKHITAAILLGLLALIITSPVLVGKWAALAYMGFVSQILGG